MIFTVIYLFIYLHSYLLFTQGLDLAAKRGRQGLGVEQTRGWVSPGRDPVSLQWIPHEMDCQPVENYTEKPAGSHRGPRLADKVGILYTVYCIVCSVYFILYNKQQSR